VNKNPTDATVCRYLFTAKLLYMFRVSQHPSSGVLRTVPAASGTGHITCTATPLQRGFAVNKYLHTVASVGFLFTLNYDARNHELKNLFVILLMTDSVQEQIYVVYAGTRHNIVVPLHSLCHSQCSSSTGF